MSGLIYKDGALSRLDEVDEANVRNSLVFLPYELMPRFVKISKNSLELVALRSAKKVLFLKREAFLELERGLF